MESVMVIVNTILLWEGERDGGGGGGGGGGKGGRVSVCVRVYPASVYATWRLTRTRTWQKSKTTPQNNNNTHTKQQQT